METKVVDIGKFDNKHDFLAEEVLIPNVDKTDSSRTNMFDSHVVQSLVLKDTQRARVFTNFENMVGKYSSSYRKSDRDWNIIAKINKNAMNSLFVLQDENGLVDVVYEKPCERVTERYGYTLENDGLKGKEVGDGIADEDVIFRSTAYDKDLNFGFGLNLKSVYLPWKNMTYEDAIVVSESARDRLSSFTVDDVVITLNTNDMLCNLYGDKDNYKCFPDIGEDIVNSIVSSRRRINYDSILYDGSVQNLMKVNYSTDTPFYSKGTIVDIDIFCNTTNERLEKHMYHSQILKYHQENTAYYEEIVRVLEPIIEGGNYSDDAGYIYTRAKEIISEDVNWKYEGSDFDNLIIKFKVLYEQPLVIGSKLTGRYGNKGCVSLILPDDEMPVNEFGERADVVLNPLGIINRLNPSQMYEQEINFLSDNIQRECKKLWDINTEESIDEMTELFFDYINSANEVQHDFMVDYYNELDEDETVEFWEDIFEDGIFIHQSPFFNNITFDQLGELYKKYPQFKPYSMSVGGKKIIQPLIMGDLYFLKLKHEPKSKFSARSSSYVNLKNIPSKSTRFKLHQSLYTKTPVRIGEMELTNLFLTNDIKNVIRLMSQYSINQEDRQEVIKHLLTDDIFNLEKIPQTGESSRTKMIFDIYMKTIGMEVVDE